MTIGETTVKIDEIFKNVKGGNANFTESIIDLGKELGSIPQIGQKVVTTLADFEKITLPDDEVQNLATSFANLSDAEKKAALSFISFKDDKQQNSFNNSVSDLSSGEALNSSLFQQELATKSLDEQTQKLILTEAGLIDSHGKYNVVADLQAQENIKASTTFNALNDAQKAEVLAAEADVVAKQTQKAANSGLIASNGLLALSFEAVKKAMIGIGIGVAIAAITAAVSAGIKALDEYANKYVHAYENTVDASKEANTSFKEEQSTIESLRNEIDKNTKSLKELREAKKGVSDEDAIADSEIESLENQNAQLEANIRLHEILAQKEAKMANDNAEEALGMQRYNTHLAEPQYTSEFSDGLHDTVSDMTGEQYLRSQIEEWNKLNAELTEASKNYAALENPTKEQTAAFEEQSSQIKAQMEVLDNNITNVYSDLNEIFNSISDDGSDSYKELAERSAESADIFNDWSKTAHGLSSALNEASDAAENSVVSFDKINEAIDTIQSAFKSLDSAVQEYNTYGGISLDTLQEILALDDKYVNCLVDQNGQLALNMDSFQALAKMRLQEAEATAVEQAIQELKNVTDEDEVANAGAVCGAIGDKVNSLAVLGEQYGNVAGCAIALANAEALVSGYQNAYTTNSAKAKEIMGALDKRLELIHHTLNNVSGSARGAANALGGFSNSAKDASKEAERLKDALNSQKDELEKQQKQLKAYGNAIVDNLDKQIDKLKKEQELQDKLYEKEIDDLNDKKDALEKANDEQDRAIKLSELQEALDRAKSAKTVRNYTHEKGFEWVANENDVQSAQGDLDDQIRDNNREDAIKAIEDEIAAIEKLKDAYDDSINAQIDKIQAVKDKWQESIDLIGDSWDEYQMRLDAAAIASSMTLEEIANGQTSFNDSVIENMRALYDIEQQLTEAENALSEAKNAGSGSSYIAGAALDEVIPKYQALLDEIKDLGEKSNSLNSELDINNTTYSNLSQSIHDVADKLRDATAGTDEYNKLTDQYNRLSERRSEISDNIALLQGEIANNEGRLTEKTAEYIEALSNEADMTEEARNTQLAALVVYCQEYGINYDKVAGVLDAYIEKMAGEGGITEQNEAAYENMRSVIEQFKINVDKYMDESIQSVQKLIDKLDEAARKRKVAGVSGSGGGFAIGTIGVKRSGVYHVDEQGKELITRRSANGRYTYLEQGDGVIPASYSRNLWNIGANPSEWFESQYNKFARNNNSDDRLVTAGGINYNTTIGDIHISQPVGDVNTLARAIQRELPNATRRIMTRR